MDESLAPALKRWRYGMHPQATEMRIGSLGRVELPLGEALRIEMTYADGSEDHIVHLQYYIATELGPWALWVSCARDDAEELESSLRELGAAALGRGSGQAADRERAGRHSPVAVRSSRRACGSIQPIAAARSSRFAKPIQASSSASHSVVHAAVAGRGSPTRRDSAVAARMTAATGSARPGPQPALARRVWSSVASASSIGTRSAGSGGSESSRQTP